MSFVVCVCGEYFSTIMSDGRMVSLPNNKVVDENIPKVLKINNNVAIGFTGDPSPTVIALEELKKYNVELLTLERIKRIIINKIKELNINELGVKIIFTGRNKVGKFVIYVVDSKNNYECEPLYPINTSPAFAVCGRNDNKCQEIIKNNLYNKKWRTSDELEKSMMNCIIDAAKIDKTVNTNMFKVVIR